MKRDVIGKRFGRLVAIRCADDSRNHAIWECDCGVEKRIYIYSVLNGDSRSCGCLNVELMTNNTRQRARFDLSGTRYGRLLVLRMNGMTASNGAAWECQCDCGRETTVSAHALRASLTRSCGCLQRERAKQTMTKHGQYKEKSYLHAKRYSRRARERGAMVEVVDPAVVYDRDMGLCQLCGLPVEDGDFNLDHRVPLMLGGQHSYANCQTSHAHCNISKRAKPPEECAYLWKRGPSWH